MKYVVVLLIVCLLCATPSLQIPEFKNCPLDIIESMQDGCSIVTCNGTNILQVACPIYQCVGTPLRIIEQDNCKPYPECCGGPVCKKC